MHYGLEVGIVLSGQMRRWYRDRIVELQPGQVWFCGVWEGHGWAVPARSCTHVILTMLPQLVIGARFQEASAINWMAPFTVPPKDRPQAHGKTKNQVLALAERFVPHLQSHPDSVTWSELLAFELLFLLLSQWDNLARESPSVPDGDYATLGCAVESVLRSRERITAREAARDCAVSPPSLRRAFTRLMGTTFSEFALCHRLGQVAALLRETTDPIVAIATNMGFTDSARLAASFSPRYGMSPRQFRRKYQDSKGKSRE